jgi:hypothetical protein
MSAHRHKPVDPRLHAVRTLAALLVRHGPHRFEPDPPPVAVDVHETANDAEQPRRAA